MSTMVKKLEESHITLRNALDDPQIGVLLARYGYDFETLQKGLALYEASYELLQTENSARFSKVATSQSFNAQWKQAQRQFNYDRRAARLLLKEVEAAHHFLQLGGETARTFDGWYGQANDFYKGLQERPELQAMVAQMGITSERVEQGIQMLQTLRSMRMQRHSERAHVVGILAQRNETLQQFEQWMFAFRGIARFALADNPAYLEKLGLKSLTRKQKKQPETKIESSHTIDMTTLMANA